MADAGEGLIDAQNRIQERMDEREEERARRAMPQGRSRSRAVQARRIAASGLYRAEPSAPGHDTHRAAPAADERAGRARAPARSARRAPALTVVLARHRPLADPVLLHGRAESDKFVDDLAVGCVNRAEFDSMG